MDAARLLLIWCLLCIHACGTVAGSGVIAGAASPADEQPSPPDGAGRLLIADADRDQVVGASPPGLDADSVGLIDARDVEPNDTFDLAVRLRGLGQEVLSIEGRIDVVGDIDVFDLGSLQTGDRVVIDLVRLDEPFRPSLALFDEQHRVFFIANDPYTEGGPAAFELIDAPIRRDTPHGFLAVTGHPDGADVGAYHFDIRIEEDNVAGPEKPQQVLLAFDGGVLPRPIFGVTNVAPFDAARIAPDYAQQGAVIKQAILDTLRENFEGFDITFVTTDRAGDLLGDEHTTLYFGSTHENLLGASDPVDEFNRDRSDNAIVFTEQFDSATIGFTRSAEDLGRAIGNVASHELGHLLGLYHVQGEQAVMNQTARARDLFIDQEFSTAPLLKRVFPIGTQDAILRLAETIGTR